MQLNNSRKHWSHPNVQNYVEITVNSKITHQLILLFVSFLSHHSNQMQAQVEVVHIQMLALLVLYYYDNNIIDQTIILQ